jgi:hypothetical protein
MKEIWKYIPGYEGLYKVSNLGRIKSVPRKCYAGPKTKMRTVRAKIKKQGLLKNGYLVTTLYKDNVGTLFYVHRIVLLTFVGPCPPNMEARHVNKRDKTDVRLSNLKWGTAKDQHQDKIRHGTDHVGERHPSAKLTEEKVLKARLLRESGWGYQKIANLLEVNLVTVYDCITKKTWGHI